MKAFLRVGDFNTTLLFLYTFVKIKVLIELQGLTLSVIISLGLRDMPRFKTFFVINKEIYGIDLLIK